MPLRSFVAIKLMHRVFLDQPDPQDPQGPLDQQDPQGHPDPLELLLLHLILWGVIAQPSSILPLQPLLEIHILLGLGTIKYSQQI
jgi:hypothetical protein